MSNYDFEDEEATPTIINYESVDILVVEDNDSDRRSIVETLRTAIPDVHIASMSNGVEALDFLLARGAWACRADEEPPKLILLDLLMPGADGFSVLGQIRSIQPQDALTVTPVVIFTDSSCRENIRESYLCGANSYIIKPLSFPDFQSIVKAVGQYWTTFNTVSPENLVQD